MIGVISKTSPGHRPSSYEALCPDTDRKCYLAVTWGIRAFSVYACLSLQPPGCRASYQAKPSYLCSNYYM